MFSTAVPGPQRCRLAALQVSKRQQSVQHTEAEKRAESGCQHVTLNCCPVHIHPMLAQWTWSHLESPTSAVTALREM